MDTDSVGG